MPYVNILRRIRRLFKSASDPDLDDIEQGFRKGALTPPAHPMSDPELARAIRTFQASAMSYGARQKLAKRLADGSDPRPPTRGGGSGRDRSHDIARPRPHERGPQ